MSRKFHKINPNTKFKIQMYERWEEDCELEAGGKWVPCKDEYIIRDIFCFGCGDYGAYVFIREGYIISLAPDRAKYDIFIME